MREYEYAGDRWQQQTRQKHNRHQRKGRGRARDTFIYAARAHGRQFQWRRVRNEQNDDIAQTRARGWSTGLRGGRRDGRERRQQTKYFGFVFVPMNQGRLLTGREVGEGGLETEGGAHENRSSLIRDIPEVLVILSENLREDIFAVGGKRL